MNEAGLTGLGFNWIPEYRIWIHHALRKSLSHQVARDAYLLHWAPAERTDPGEFWFYRASELDDNRTDVAAHHFKILRHIGMQHLQPLIRLGTLTVPLHTPSS
jgi:hypothetical protein